MSTDCRTEPRCGGCDECLQMALGPPVCEQCDRSIPLGYQLCAECWMRGLGRSLP